MLMRGRNLRRSRREHAEQHLVAGRPPGSITGRTAGVGLEWVRLSGWPGGGDPRAESAGGRGQCLTHLGARPGRAPQPPGGSEHRSGGGERVHRRNRPDRRRYLHASSIMSDPNTDPRTVEAGTNVAARSVPQSW